MIHRALLIALLGAGTLLFAAPALSPTSAIARPDPKAAAAEGFERLSKALASGDDATLDALAPRSLLPKRGQDTESVKAWRTELADTLQDAKLVRARAEGTDAVVRVTTADGVSDYELVMGLEGKQWVLAAPRPYLVRGPFLKDANGSKPQLIKLTARTTNKAYGTAAFSFAHVTQNPVDCKNRMDVWFCHNQDLHGSGKTRIAKLSTKSLGKVLGIPLGVTWSDKITPTSGAVYVAHCKRDGHRDFYVAFQAKKVGTKSMQLQWTLLAAGLGAPARIDTPQPLRSNDGADGCDGLCGK